MYTCFLKPIAKFSSVGGSPFIETHLSHKGETAMLDARARILYAVGL